MNPTKGGDSRLVTVGGPTERSGYPSDVGKVISGLGDGKTGPPIVTTGWRTIAILEGTSQEELNCSEQHDPNNRQQLLVDQEGTRNGTAHKLGYL